MSEEQDDLTLVYMYGFKNGERGMKVDIEQLHKLLDTIGKINATLTATVIEKNDEIERLRAALHDWDALIRHQYSGSQEAMSDMTYAAQHTAHVLHGKEPWPMQTRVEKLEAALREAREDILLRHNARGSEALGTDEEVVRFIDAALEGEKTDD